MARRPVPAVLAVIATAVASALVLAGCAGGSASAGSSASTADTPQRGGTYTHAFSAVGAITSLDPPTLIFHEALHVVRTLTDSLVDQDPKTGKIVPWIATKWTVSPDARTYVFTLRKGGTFSDGTPIDAAAVKANFDRDAAPGRVALLFRDRTSGVSTYAALRELLVELPADGDEVELDFNRAANRNCAYTDHAICPLPPAGNELDVAVEEGEGIPLERTGATA